MTTTRTDYHEVSDGQGNILESTEEVVDITEETNKSAIETNLAQDLDAMQAIVDMTNADINANPAAVIKDIARMNKRLGRKALDDYSEAD